MLSKTGLGLVLASIISCSIAIPIKHADITALGSSFESQESANDGAMLSNNKESDRNEHHLYNLGEHGVQNINILDHDDEKTGKKMHDEERKSASNSVYRPRLRGGNRQSKRVTMPEESMSNVMLEPEGNTTIVVFVPHDTPFVVSMNGATVDPSVETSPSLSLCSN